MPSGAGGSTPSGTRSPFGVEYTSDFGGLSLSGATLNSQSRTDALYAQSTYKLDDYVEVLSFTGGFRWTWDKFYNAGGSYCISGKVKTPGNPFLGQPCVSAANPFGTLTTFTSQSARFTSPAYTVAINYQWRPQTMFYISD